jgi:nickel-dependent lactate racemase
MIIDIPYGQSQMQIEVDDSRRIHVVSPRETAPDELAIARALTHTSDFPDLASFLSQRKKILVVVNDHTRPTPSTAVLQRLELNGKDVNTIIASGAHRAPSQSELEHLLDGRLPPYGGEVIVHDSSDESQLKLLGHTGRGTEVCLNKEVFEADGIIAIGSVEPHYFAGFTGGRKFLLPGLAAVKSIEMNHSLALDKESTILRLEGNPIHEDFMDALNMFDRYDDIFSIQLVLNRNHDVSYAHCGHILHSFLRAVDHAKEVYVAPISAKADVMIVVVTPPMDLDLYQAHKAIENARLALNDQGVMILVSPCEDGIGPREFYDLLASGHDVFGKISKGYKLGDHKAAKLVQLQQKAKLMAVTNLSPSTLEKINITPHKDVQSALDEATRLKGKEARILVVLDGCLTVPFPTS